MTRNQIEYWKLKHEERASERSARIQARYNRESVAEQKRANLARERETQRANTINFALQKARDEAQKNHWDWSRAETAAHNRRSEELTAEQNATYRQNYERQHQLEQQRIDLGYYQSQASLEGTKYAAGANYANVAMMDRANIARQAEINRSNLVTEDINQQNAQTRSLEAKSGMLNAQANVQNAATRAREQVLDATKWNVAQLPKTRMETELLAQQAQSQIAQRDRWTEQSHVERVNAFSNTLGALGRIAGQVVAKGAVK